MPRLSHIAFRRYRLAGGLAAVLSMLCLAGGCNSSVNIPLSEVDLVPITPGAPPITRADLAGKVVVINFWATWCGPCVREFPDLMRLKDAYQGRSDFVFLSVSTGHPSVEAIRSATVEFLSTTGYKLPVYADPTSRTRLGLSSVVEPGVVPVTVLVDRQGVVAKVIVGFDPAKLEELRLQAAGMMQSGSVAQAVP